MEKFKIGSLVLCGSYLGIVKNNNLKIARIYWLNWSSLEGNSETDENKFTLQYTGIISS